MSLKSLASEKKYLQSTDIMNTDRRIVPEKHISKLLEEEHLLERTNAVKHRLIRSSNKLDKIAECWVDSTGLNCLARVILTNVKNVPHTHPKKTKLTTKHSHVSAIALTKTDPARVIHKNAGIILHDDHHDKKHDTVTDHSPSENHLLVSHAPHHADHGHSEHHDVHGHDHHTASHTTQHESHGHGGHHDAHGNGHHDDHGHHGHGHGHHGGHFSSFMSSGHWCGQQGARIFAMIGRIVGEMVGYIIKTLMVAILFGPTRTALLVFFISIFLNNTVNTSLPIGISAGIAGMIHLIFTGLGMIGGGGGHGGGEGHGHH